MIVLAKSNNQSSKKAKKNGKCFYFIKKSASKNKSQTDLANKSDRKDSPIALLSNYNKKRRTKILILIATVSITFALTWFPVHFIQIWRTVFREYFPFNDLMYIIKVIAHTLSYSNSLLNPFIYVFCGTKFRSLIYDEFSTIIRVFSFKKSSNGSSSNSRDLNYQNKGSLDHNPINDKYGNTIPRANHYSFKRNSKFRLTTVL